MRTATRQDTAGFDPVVVEGREYPDYPGIAEWYADLAATGSIPVCKWTRLAAERFLRMRERAESGKAEFWWSPEHIVDVCSFQEKLPHVEAFTGNLVLEPWQIFSDAAIWGFRRHSDGGRLVTRVSEYVPRKHGKAEAVENEIPTPTGFKTMGDIQPGDLVFAADGSPTRVTAVSEVWQDRPLMAVEFSTGEVIVVDEAHEWLTTARVDRPGSGPGTYDRGERRQHTRVRETREIAETLRCGRRGDNNHAVSVAAPVDMPEADLPLDPYVLGVWLAEGSTSTIEATATVEDWAFYETEFARSGVRVGPARPKPNTRGVKRSIFVDGVADPNRPKATGFRLILERLGVWADKHIPEPYLFGSIPQRWRLLAGLMDTDGTVDRGRGKRTVMCEFNQKDRRIAAGVHQLVASLGMKPHWRTKRARIGEKDYGDHHIIAFAATRDKPVFLLPRKRDLLPEPNGKPCRSQTRMIVDVRPAGRGATKCIEIDHPSHLYLTGRSFIPTHNSLRTAMRAHFVMTCEGEPGPLGFIGAATKDQASKVFDPMKKLAEKSPALREHFGITATLDEIRYGCNGGVVYRMTSKAESQDGHNPHLVIMEELHAQDAGLIEVMQSALGGRANPLLLSISTAGRTAMGIGWENWRWLQRILEGEVARDRSEHVFGLIYTIDEGDEERLHEEEVIRKANPGYPVAPRREAVRQELADSQATPGALAEFKRTRFNIWSRAANALLRQDDWARCADTHLKREEYVGKPGFAGADLASRNDLAATCLLFEDGPTIAAFWRYYICEGAPVFEQSPELATLYLSWADAGWLRITPGAYIDFNVIRDELVADLERFGISRVGVDDWQANQFIADLQAEGYEPVAVKKTARNITEPTDEILARVKDQTFIHDGNPISEWCATNVVAFRDENDNILPKRDKTKPLDKIDGFDALVNANAVRLTYREERQVSVYERRGLLGVGEEERRS